jgi:hypothetical protein
MIFKLIVPTDVIQSPIPRQIVLTSRAFVKSGRNPLWTQENPNDCHSKHRSQAWPPVRRSSGFWGWLGGARGRRRSENDVGGFSILSSLRVSLFFFSRFSATVVLHYDQETTRVRRDDKIQLLRCSLPRLADVRNQQGTRIRVACIPSRRMQLAQNDPAPVQALRLDHPCSQRINYSSSGERAARPSG